MKTLNLSHFIHNPRPWLVALVGFAVFVEVLFLSPSTIDEPESSSLSLSLDADDLLISIQEDGPPIAPGVPTSSVPDYTIAGFNFTSTRKQTKEWKMVAKKAYLFQKEKLVHARSITAYLYNAEMDEPPTLVKGREAKYVTADRDLEVFGEVDTIFPDGFTLKSDYLQYNPIKRIINIPENFSVVGKGKPDKDGQYVEFKSHGLHYEMGKNEVLLPSTVEFMMVKPKERTTIRSDRCVIDRKIQTAHFEMEASRPLQYRFVHITQPNLLVKSRTADLRYGTSSDILHALTALTDVDIQEKSEDDGVRSATCGRADFDTKKNHILLTQLPQVYQDGDTITGERIILHRDTDIVEVEQSNAFSEGSQSPKKNRR